MKRLIQIILLMHCINSLHAYNKVVYKTSGSQMGGYPAFCLLAAKNENIFATFRRNINFVDVVETLSYELGLEFEKAIVEHYPHLLKYADKICLGDIIGNPIPRSFKSFGTCSPTTLRYVKIAGDLERIFGNVHHMNIVEIGGGCGGQCKILHDVCGFSTYTIVDIPEVTPLIKKFLGKFNISNVATIDNIDVQEPMNFDLVMSNYAFSEIDRKEQLNYIENIISRAPRGYIIHNLMAFINPLSLDELRGLLSKYHKNIQVTKEDPLTGDNNFVITWNSIE